MTRQPHDQFAKQYLEELLSPLGTIEISREISDETRQIDVFFSPNPNAVIDCQRLGILGKIATQTTLIEPFRNAPTKTETRNCILKLFSIFAQLQRQAKRENITLAESNLPHLWILATSVSSSLLASFDAKLDLENWKEGIYFLSEAHRTAIIAINQLPVTAETLLLRLLGRGQTQNQAVRELLALPKTDSLRQKVTELLVSWRVSVEIQNTLEEQDREVFMALSQAFLEWKEATKQEGRQEGRQEGQQEGRQEGRRQIIENLLQVRFGELDEMMNLVVDALLELPPAESSHLVLEFSRDELLSWLAERKP